MKKWYVYVNGRVSVAPRPKYQASQGTTVDTHGIRAASQASDTGLTVSGVEETSIRSIFWVLMRSAATLAACWGLDPLSRLMISMLCFFLLMMRPSAKASRTFFSR
jgi:hypothetical protein